MTTDIDDATGEDSPVSSDGDEDTVDSGPDAAGAEDLDVEDLDDMAGNRIYGATARGVLEYVARNIAEEPDAVAIDEEQNRGGIRYKLHVAPDDMGRIIGRRGRVAQAIRTVVRAAGARDDIDANVDIVDE